MWSLVHGFTCLLIDGRLQPLLAMTEGKPDALTLLKSIMNSPAGQ